MKNSRHESEHQFFMRLNSSSIQLIAIDIDGTLLDSQQNLRSSVIEAIGNVVEKGYMVSLVSGRPRCAISEYLQLLPLNAPDITSGGAFIYDPSSKHVIMNYLLPSDATKVVVKTARKTGVDIIFGYPDIIYYEGKSDFLERERGIADEHLQRTTDILQFTDKQPGKIMLVGEQGILKRLEYTLRTLEQPLHITYSGSTLLDVTHENVNKGTALQHLEKYLDVPLEMVLAVGDSPNDISMFDVTGFSIAMGNAHDEVKHHADFIAPTNDDEGLAWVLQQLL